MYCVHEGRCRGGLDSFLKKNIFEQPLSFGSLMPSSISSILVDQAMLPPFLLVRQTLKSMSKYDITYSLVCHVLSGRIPHTKKEIQINKKII